MKHHIIIRMTHTLAWLLLLCVGVTVLGCSPHEHDWIEASCTEPFHCEGCEMTAGEALGHAWLSATCTEPTRCSVCSVTQGDTPTHTWAEADCEHPQTCTVCGETQGEARGHFWRNATCETAQTCDRCGTTKGEPRGHLLTEANCTDDVVCRICKKTRALAPGHDWIEPTCHTPQTCRRCGLKTEQYAAHSYVGAAVCGKQRTCIECGRKEPVVQHTYNSRAMCTRCGREITLEELEQLLVFRRDCLPGSWEENGERGTLFHFAVQSELPFDVKIRDNKVYLYATQTMYAQPFSDVIRAKTTNENIYLGAFVGFFRDDTFALDKDWQGKGESLFFLILDSTNAHMEYEHCELELVVECGNQAFLYRMAPNGDFQWTKIE